MAKLVCVILWLTAFSTLSAPLEVIPQPREIKETATKFDPGVSRFIVVSDNADDRFAARLVHEAILDTHGVDCETVLLPVKSTNQHVLWLGAATNFPSMPPPVRGSESYQLNVRSEGVWIAAENDAGLFYGTQTLIQLLEQSHRDRAAMPGMSIIDWPLFGWRARYFDASQYFGSIVVTRANLEHEIKELARFKLNWLCFDAYNYVPFKSFPACATADTMPAADWNYLVELARQYHMTLVPSLQSFGQMYDVIWKCDEGKPYRETTAPGLLCPSRPENILFLQGLYGDLISIFKYSPVLGVGCSETSMQWDKKYCPLCQARIARGETEQDIYCRHVSNCVTAVAAAAKEAGRAVRPMMWADEFYMGYGGKRWVGIEHIPTNTVMGHWMYWKNYDTIGGLLERGYDVFFLSASYQHNLFLIDLSPQDPVDGKWAPLLESGIRNITDQAKEAVADDRKGSRGKVLGGGCATFSQHDIRSWDTTWYAYALEAEYTWGEPPLPVGDELKTFTDNFAAVFYDALDAEAARTIASAYRELDAVKSDLERNNYLIRDFIGIYDVQDTSYSGNDLSASLKLIDELTLHPKGAGKTAADIRQRCDRALLVADATRHKLAGIPSRAGNAASFHYLLSAPHKMENQARRTLFLLDFAEAFRNPNTARGIFSALRQRCQDLQDDTRIIIDEMSELTRGAEATGYPKALASLEIFGQRLEKAGIVAPK